MMSLHQNIKLVFENVAIRRPVNLLRHKICIHHNKFQFSTKFKLPQNIPKVERCCFRQTWSSVSGGYKKNIFILKETNGQC